MMEARIGNETGKEREGCLRMVKQLEEENKELKKEKEVLLSTVNQMKVTLNRLISRYVLENSQN
ncbi:MAG: hypothetical protein HFG57_07975 [Lachnospiraceae bacterium]|nr:hypothetical protein [Eubacterium sp.]MCI9105881.1 hypothetical protein [Lachnospiraceae bacterium]